MRLEDIFTTEIKSWEVNATYKEYPFSIAREVIDDFKIVYGNQALDKLKSILEENYKRINLQMKTQIQNVPERIHTET
jgi:hypothetical protein